MRPDGRPRRQVLAALVPPGLHPIVDVGADHGHVAHAVGGIASERMPNRTGRGDVPWVICDGLRAYRRVGVAIIAGMGARAIGRILDAAPPVEVAIVHAVDDPWELRTWLATHGWRIDAEALAPENGRYAEVIRAVPGTEPHTGLTLEFGPKLLLSDDPYLLPHLLHQTRWVMGLAAQTERAAPAVSAAWAARRDFLLQELQRRGWQAPLVKG